MPELPEVETTRRGLLPHVVGCQIDCLDVRETRLRWPVTAHKNNDLQGARIVDLHRRGKYLLLQTEPGCLLIHLGMSGSLRFLPKATAPGKHDHYDIRFENGALLRYNDPRRFGSLTFTKEPLAHPLLKTLGPEPLSEDFTGHDLWQKSRGRRAAIKSFIMDGRIVVGVGNIYANEALYRAGIHPARPAGRVSLARYERLVTEIKAVLSAAIRSGGTTLRDFVGGDRKPGYFRQSLSVYEREGEPCLQSGHAIRRRVIGQRASYYCPSCQR